MDSKNNLFYQIKVSQKLMLLRFFPSKKEVDLLSQKILELDLYFRSLPKTTDKCQNFIQNKSEFL